MIEIVARYLGDLRERVVFLGGAVTFLLLSDPAAPDVRPTRDVDVIVEATKRSDYYQLEENLRSLGFTPVPEEDAPICRWRIGEVLVDIMPTDEKILGFSNPWYPAALENSVNFPISDDLTIRLITAPHFLATKIEAFLGRGKKDFRGSPDMEDIIAILDGRIEIVEEIEASNHELKKYLAAQFKALLENKLFLEAVPGHLRPDAASQKRLGGLIEKIRTIATRFE